jgi:hypothetical protein
MLVYELDSDDSVNPKRYRKMSSAKKAAQRSANRLGRAVTILGFPAGMFTSGSPSEADTYTRVLPKSRSKGNSRKVKGKSTTLRNMAFVSITKQRNGVVKITGRKMGNPVRRSGRKPRGRTARRKR